MLFASINAKSNLNSEPKQMGKVILLARMILTVLISALVCTSCGSAAGDEQPTSAGITEQTDTAISAEDIADEDSKPEISISTSPGNDAKWIGSGDGIVRNLNAHQNAAIIIRIAHKDAVVEIAANDSVTMDSINDVFIIGDDTLVDIHGNIMRQGTGSCTITKTNAAISESVSPPAQDGNSDEQARAEYEQSGFSLELVKMLPYMGQSLIDEIAAMEYDKNGFKNFDTEMVEYDADGNRSTNVVAYSYISESTIDELAKKEYAKTGFENFSMHIYPYISESLLDELVQEEFEKSGFDNLSMHIYSYISDSLVDLLAVRECEENGFADLPFQIYPYISDSTIDELARGVYVKSGFSYFPNYVYSYISEGVIDQLALAEYETKGLDSLSYIANYVSGGFIEQIKQKEYEKTGTYPLINNGIGRVFNHNAGNFEIIETPFIGEIRYIKMDINAEESEETMKIGKDGELAVIYTSNANVTVTVKDAQTQVVVSKESDGAVSVTTTKQDGNIESTQINPDANPVITVMLSDRTVEVSQTQKDGTAYVTITRGDVKAKIEIAGQNSINILDYLNATLYENAQRKSIVNNIPQPKR